MSPVYAQTQEPTPPIADSSVSQQKNADEGKKILAQVRILGLKRVKEEAVRARMKAKEFQPYPPEDKALDMATLLASGDFSEVHAKEVSLGPSAFRLDIEVVEASAPISISTETAAAPAVSTQTPIAAAVAPSTTSVSASTMTALTPATTGQELPPPPPPPAVVKKEPGQLNPPWVIGDIGVQGNHHIAFTVIRSQLKARKGDLYYKSDLETDIQALLRMGSFERVKADISSIPDKPVPSHLLDASGSTSTIKLTLLVDEKPRVHKIKFQGYKKIGRGKLMDTITVKEKDPLDRAKIKEDVTKMLDLYHERGYLGAAIDPQVAIDTKTADADITYSITEGPKTIVGAVKINGLTVFKPKKIYKQMENHPKGWFNKIYQEGKLEDDLKKIGTLYKNNGYLDFQITTHTVEYSLDRTSVTISMDFSEGKQYRFGTTSFSGYQVYASSELVKSIEYKRGKIFNQEKYESTIRNVQELYAERGYLRARVTPEKTYNEKTGEMDVSFGLSEGNIVYVDHVDVEGNQSTKSYVFLREVLVKRGDPFSSTKIRKSHEKIMNLGFIDDVQLDIQSPVDPDKVDLTFEITEGKPGMLTAGAGFSSLDGLIGTLSMQHLNLFGRAQRGSIQWQFGSRVQDYSLSWTTPWLGDHPTSLGFDAFNTRRIRPFESSISGFTDKRRGGSIRLGPRFKDDMYQMNLTYTYQQISVTNVQTDFQSILPEGTQNHSSAGLELARDTRDNIWDPTRGSRHAIGATLAGGPLFGDVNFFKPFLTDSINFHLASVSDYPLVLTLANRGAYASQFGKTKDIPVFDRFFLGGQDSLRGYSATGEVGVPTGGKVYDVANAELGFPLARERRKTIVKIVGFLDVGGTWENMRSVRFRVGSQEQDLKSDIGIGIRFVTPAFPIRLDYGYGLNHRQGERLYQINFGIGPLF